MSHNLFSYSVIPFLFLLCLFPLAQAQIDTSCPDLVKIVKDGVSAAFVDDNRIAASLLRLHFHDCFVNGCDASILLDDTNDFSSEKNAKPNNNSVRGFEVIDSIKADVEEACPLTVSCADILALAAREAVSLSGGPFWPVQLGRLDGFTASESAANAELPAPFEPLENITVKFLEKGLDIKDVVVLSGAHTIGYAQCFTFKDRLFNYKGSGQPDPALDSSALANLQSTCPDQDDSDSNLVPLDPPSVYRFDNLYYKNLVKSGGLLESDQALMRNPMTAAQVKAYSKKPNLFSKDFAASMVKISNIGILTGEDGEIREYCWSVN